MAKTCNGARLWTLSDDPECAVIGADGRLYVHARPEKCVPAVDVLKELKTCFTEKMLDSAAATISLCDLSGSDSDSVCEDSDGSVSDDDATSSCMSDDDIQDD